MASSPHHLHGTRYKLLYKSSKSGKSSSSSNSHSSSKSVKAVLGKSSKKSAAKDPSYYSFDHEAVEVHHRPSLEPTNMETTLLTPIDDLPAMVTVVPSAMPSSLQSEVEFTTNPPTALLGTTAYPIASPHIHDVDTEMMEHPTYSPTIHHNNLFTPSVAEDDDDHYQVDPSFAPTTATTLSNDDPAASRAPSSTIQPPSDDSSPLTDVPTTVVYASMSPTVVVVEGLFGSTPTTGEESFTAIPTLSNEDDTGMDWLTLQPSSSSSSSPLIGTTPPTDNNEASFAMTVTLSSDETTSTSFIPSSTPTTIITSALPSSNVPTSFQELNLLNNPNTQEEAQQLNSSNMMFQGAASLMVIVACAMVIMGTLYGLFAIMKRDEQNVLDEYGAQLAGAAAFDADDIGEVVNVEGGAAGGGGDSHLQLVTD